MRRPMSRKRKRVLIENVLMFGTAYAMALGWIIYRG